MAGTKINLNWFKQSASPIYDGNFPNMQRPEAGWRANEPMGFTQLTTKQFNTLTELETSTDPDWFLTSTVGNKSIVTDATAPQSAPNILRHTYPAGFSGGAAGTSAGFTGGSNTEFYICVNARWDVNWQPHPTGTNKTLFVTMSDFGGGGDPLFLFYDTDAGQGDLKLEVQGPGVGRSLTPQTLMPITLGDWYLVEIYLQMNSTSAASDGTAQLWVNGIQTTLYTDVQFYNDGGSAGLWNNAKLEPTWGGSGGTVVSPFSLDHDEIYISGN